MKRSITTLLCLLTLTGCLLAQTSNVPMPDTVNIYQVPTDDYPELFHLYFTYNKDSLLSMGFRESSDPSRWLRLTDEFLYDNNKLCSLSYRQLDSYLNPNPTPSLYKTEYQYNLDGQTALAIQYYYNYHEMCWMQNIYNEYHYDTLGRRTEEIIRRIARTANILYEYSPNTIIKHIGSYSDSVWTEACTVTRTFSDDGLLLSSLRIPSQGDSLLTMYTYDAMDAITEALTCSWNNGVLEERDRVVYENNSEGWPVVIQFEHWNGQEWVEGVSQYYDYVLYTITDRDYFIFQDERLNRQGSLIASGRTNIRRIEIQYAETSPFNETQEQLQREPDIALCPNPATGQVTVTGEGIRKVEVYNLLGQQVFSMEANGNKSVLLDLSGLAKGVYLVTVTNKEGRNATKRLIVR